jgi:alpha-L-fucosidase
LENRVALFYFRSPTILFFFQPPSRDPRQVDEHVTYPPQKKINRNKNGQKRGETENVSITGQRPTGFSKKKNKYKKYFTQIRNLKNEIVTYHHRIDFIVVAIHPIGGHGFSVFDANFGHFLSGAG